MTNYYEILGLDSGAGILEIKASFRQLAKRYHPDKNPEGIEHFTQILKAYETLSDPTLKASYDYKLNYHQSQSRYQTKNPVSTKTWKFDERELKRRQYYNDHIKKYAKQTSEYMAEAETKKNYNEFKYILFATPLAVILFLLIMNLASRDRREIINSDVPTPSATKGPETISENNLTVKTGDAPYASVFGSAKYDSLSNKKIKVKNFSNKDVIICLSTKKEFVCCLYLKESDTLEIALLPPGTLEIRYYTGSNFNSLKQWKEKQLVGAFTENAEFYKSIGTSRGNSFSELTLLPSLNKGFKETDEKDFFKHAKK